MKSGKVDEHRQKSLGLFHPIPSTNNLVNLKFKLDIQELSAAESSSAESLRMLSHLRTATTHGWKFDVDM